MKPGIRSTTKKSISNQSYLETLGHHGERILVELPTGFERWPAAFSRLPLCPVSQLAQTHAEALDQRGAFKLVVFRFRKWSGAGETETEPQDRTEEDRKRADRLFGVGGLPPSALPQDGRADRGADAVLLIPAVVMLGVCFSVGSF